MIGNGWNDLGRDLSRMVDDAVRNRNFQSLNTSINDTIRRAFEETPLSGQKPMGGYDFKLSKDEPETTSSQGPPFTGTPNKTSNRYNDVGQAKLFLKRRKKEGTCPTKIRFRNYTDCAWCCCASGMHYWSRVRNYGNGNCGRLTDYSCTYGAGRNNPHHKGKSRKETLRQLR